MNIATGSLILLGFILFAGGIISKFMGMSVMAPFINAPTSYLTAGNACLLLVLIVERFQKN